MPRPPLWTPRDLDDLRAICGNRKTRILDWKKLHERFPNRSDYSIYKKIQLIGIGRPRSWSSREDEILRLNWNDMSVKLLRRYLPGRTRIAVYERARKLGLSAGTPQGMVSVKALSEDPSWGYDYYKTLRILKSASVGIRSFGYTGKKRGVRYVELDEAHQAAAEWERRVAEERVGKETPKEAAARLRLREGTLRNWLSYEGLMPPKRREVKRKFWALPEVFDRVYEKYRGGLTRPKRIVSPSPECR